MDLKTINPNIKTGLVTFVQKEIKKNVYDDAKIKLEKLDQMFKVVILESR